MKAIINFIKAIFGLPLGNLIWVMVLGISNMLAPLFFFSHVEAKVMFYATILGLLIGAVMYQYQGLTRLMGLMHTPLLVVVYFLLKTLFSDIFAGAFGVWVIVALILTIASLVLDVRDVILYIGGDRENKS